MSRNISKENREKILNYIIELKNNTPTSNIEQLLKLREIENYIDGQTYGLIFEKHEEELSQKIKTNVPVCSLDKSRTIKSDDNGMNFLIEGDNLHSLSVLSRTHKHSLDVIYIDPPYNTGAKDWKYDNNICDKNFEAFINSASSSQIDFKSSQNKFAGTL